MVKTVRNRITSTKYDAGKRKLSVAFASGRAFEFHAVPSRIAALLSQAVDPVSYFDREIRGQYPWLERHEGRVVRHVFAANSFPTEIRRAS